MGVRTRMTPQQRRAQLLDLGAELFAEQHYDDVHIERVAELAGVSRGLLYHYFPTKRAFFAELVRRATERMLADTAPDPQLPLLEQLRHGIDAYLASCRANRHGSQAIYSGAASSDPAVIELIEKATRGQEDRILAVIDPGRDHPELLRIAVHSWLVMLRSACHAWLASEDISASDVRQMAEHALLGALAGLPDHARAGAMAQLLDINGA
ncbi:TetR/AcrR family transcriptional regulator [Williamsia sp. D3]|uniref:TetR/AcrR family transcriptional regulator n=1 Tax=Williamsia TaxID=85043 RepID=UPI0003D3921F|nr:TetR/AcrR family transcriptional regulator [Williamsia sp. D3]ETD31022.1 TetR family transcriptional regulator [Williamsia sp. D3]